MKTIIEYINEELDDNFLWKLSKWFERNEIQEKEFMNLILSCKQNGLNQKEIEKNLEGTQLYDNIKEFVNFMIDDFTSLEKDYIYQLKKIIELTINNKNTKNKWGK
jgi:hypothetical protein